MTKERRDAYAIQDGGLDCWEVIWTNATPLEEPAGDKKDVKTPLVALYKFMKVL